jgi:large subunit ribosomal protein L24
MKIRKGDQVKIISGKDRGKSGKVIKAMPKKMLVIVEGLNLVKKHIRPRRGGEKGQAVEVPRPLHVSKIMAVCRQCGKSTRIGYADRGDKKYRRICKKCGNEI